MVIPSPRSVCDLGVQDFSKSSSSKTSGGSAAPETRRTQEDERLTAERSDVMSYKNHCDLVEW